jgi:hypothetical protein
MFKRLAKRIARKHMELRQPQQPLRLQPDYLERNAADFLGENVVQVNTGIDPLRGGPGNVEDEVIADDFMADFEADELEADGLGTDELEGFEIIDDMGLGRMAKDHDRGSYMSRQNLREMSDMADFIVDDIGMEGLDDWVEDKISQSYSAMNDVARYRGYRDDYPHGKDEESTFKFAEDEIIDDLEDDDGEIFDDMGITADFDKESRYNNSKEYQDAKKEGLVPDEFLEYEGSVKTPGESPDPGRVEKNRKELSGGKYEVSGGPGFDRNLDKRAYYDIIDDLEW